jgi:suppressor of ftsI
MSALGGTGRAGVEGVFVGRGLCRLCPVRLFLHAGQCRATLPEQRGRSVVLGPRRRRSRHRLVKVLSRCAPFQFQGVSLYVVATDGHPLSRPRKMNEFLLGPGQRIDAIAIGPPAGEYAIGTLTFKNMAWRELFPGQQIATILSSGSPTPTDAEPEILRQQVARARWIDEVRASPIARQRRLVYSRTDDRSVFMIDGRVIDDERIDQTVQLGDTEEWTIVNTDQQYHGFHIHQTPFLVTEVNGIPQDEDSLRDTMSIPPATDERPGVLKVIIPFTDPEIVGRFVYHCHAVDHEDKGMMGTVLVVV